jgi:hypothetical protein
VTGLGDISPIERLFTLGSFFQLRMKNTVLDIVARR